MMAEGVKEMFKAGDTRLVEGVFLSAKEAGRKIVKDGRISEETQKAVSKIADAAGRLLQGCTSDDGPGQ
jgi:hypothetical protein